MTGVSRTERFVGALGNTLVGDVFGDRGPVVLLLHGGGQTRHAWQRTARAIAGAGMTAYAVDQRGRGDSDWIESGAYGFRDYAADAQGLADRLAERHGVRPAVAGASLGGVAALMAEGEASRSGRPALFSALVLVDITPRVDYAGIAKVQGFMRAHAREGFGSVAEAAEAVAAYLPHRPRPRSHEGLRKNLRLHSDGRWRWHWDPRFLDSRRPDQTYREAREALLADAAKSLKMSVLLVRGTASELVQEDHAKDFLALVPHASYADVPGARHMVAGDQNDQFSSAILEFLNKLSH